MQIIDAEAEEQLKQSKAAVEAMEPGEGAPTRTLLFKNWRLPNGDPASGDEGRPYVQAELGMFPAQQFGLIITSKLKGFTEGDLGARIGDLFRGEVQMPEVFDGDSVSQVVSDNEMLVKAFFKLVDDIPDLQLDIICLSLGVPRKEWSWFKECIQEPPHRGGLTVSEGFDILVYFVRQNAQLLRETYRGKAQELVEVFRLEVLGMERETVDSTAEEIDAEPTSPGGTPSSTSVVPTPVRS